MEPTRKNHPSDYLWEAVLKNSVMVVLLQIVPKMTADIAQTSLDVPATKLF